MSIWKDATYKVATARSIWKVSEDLCTTILGPRIFPYLRPYGDTNPIEPEWTWEDFADHVGWDPPKEMSEELKEEMPKFSRIQKWHVGFDAIAQMVNAITLGRFNVEPDTQWDKVLSIADEYGRITAGQFVMPDKVVANKWGQRNEEYIQISKKYDDAAQCWVKALREFSHNEDEVKIFDQSKVFGEGTRNYYGVTYGDLMLLQGAEEFVNKGLALTKSHVSHLATALERIANIYRYVATQYFSDHESASIIIEMLNLTITTLAKTQKDKVGEVCAAFHKARSFNQMEIFENLQLGATMQAIMDYEKEGYESILPLNKYTLIIQKTKMHAKMDVMQVYKWIPPPDYDTTRTFHQVKEWHTHPRPSGADLDAPKELKLLWEMIKNERKMNVACAFHSRTGQWPDDLDMKGAYPKMTDIEKWSPKGLFPYWQFGKDIVTQIKDKTTVLPIADNEINKSRGSYDTSFLLWYLKHGKEVNTKVDLVNFAKNCLEEENYVRVAYKPEAHKVDSRLFYMAPPRQRILLGEFEGNLAKVAGFYPGSLQGKTKKLRNDIIHSIMDIYTAPPGASKSIDSENYVVTFDLSKFSPKSNGNITKDYHKFWSEVFNMPELEELYRIGPESKVIHTTDGVKDEYQNHGADLEGFRGRLMTMFHADMLGAACRLARKEGYITGKAQLAVFIDDGAVKVAATGCDDEAKKNVNNFLTCMQKVYAAAGQENHPNKTVVSKVGGELLAEQFVYCNKLPTGIKAAMRLSIDHENPAAAITEEFDALVSSTQGCIKDNGDWLAAYWRLVVAYVRNIYRWVPRSFRISDALDVALKLSLPKSFGGFGLPPLISIVTTVGANLTVEGLTVMNLICRHHKGLVSSVRRLVERPIMKRDPLSILRDPDRVRATGYTIVENRLIVTTLDWLEEHQDIAPALIMNYRGESLRSHASAVAEAILSKPAVNIALLTRVWKITPLAYVENVIGKFKRAASILRLLGGKKIGAIRRKNCADVERVLTASY